VQLTTKIAALVVAVHMLLSPLSYAGPAEETDILFLIIPMLAVRCEPGEYDICSSRIGCIRMDGLWENGTCTAKSRERKNTELLAGKWFLLTLFPEGNNKSYFWFDLQSVEQTEDGEEFSIEGGAHLTSAFNTPNPVYIVGAYDDTEKDWFILEVWGQDKASLVEFTFTSQSRIEGCEYFVSYPDLRYLTGTCNAFSGNNSTPRTLSGDTLSAASEGSFTKLELYLQELERAGNSVQMEAGLKGGEAVSDKIRAALLNQNNNK
jgi:hypothetical protein